MLGRSAERLGAATLVDSCTLLCASPHYCASPYSPVHSCTLLCTPVHSCALLYSPVHSCTLLCIPPSHSLGHASEFCKSLGFVNPERDSRWQRVIFTLYACCPYTLHDPRNQTEVLALHGTARGSAVAHVLYYTRAHVHTPRDPGRSVAPTHPAASVRGYRT